MPKKKLYPIGQLFQYQEFLGVITGYSPYMHSYMVKWFDPRAYLAVFVYSSYSEYDERFHDFVKRYKSYEN